MLLDDETQTAKSDSNGDVGTDLDDFFIGHWISFQVGAQFSYADITNITSSGAPGTSASANANAISFRYQVAVGLNAFINF